MIIAAMGIFAGIYERQTYDIAGRGNAGGLSRVLPLSIWISFIIWLIVSSELRADYLAHPMHAVIALVALMLCGLGLYLMQRVRVDNVLLRLAMPIVVLRGITDVLNKSAMQHSNELFPFNLPIYIWWLAVWVTLTTLCLNYRDTKKILPENPLQPLYARPGMIMSLLLITLMGFKAAAMNYAPNPAYVTATGLLSALWVTIYHRLKRIPDASNLWAGAIIVIGTFLLLWTHK